jgi:GntR family transcriptional regulator, transcriptional repressor for pyruvate dehydrogenase complex
MTERIDQTASDLFTPIVAGRISATISAQIRSAILEGKLKPGDRLPTERELTGRFGVSRVTVRDALRALETAGLVEIRVGAAGGAFVTAPSSGLVGRGISDMLALSQVDPDEIAEARLIMELGTVGLAVDRASDEDIADLRELAERAAQALADGDYDSSMAREFHARLAAAAHNRAIDLVAETFGGPLSMHPVREREPAGWSHERSVDEHLRIVDAIEQRDVALARRLMTEHLTRGTRVSAATGAAGGGPV